MKRETGTEQKEISDRPTIADGMDESRKSMKIMELDAMFLEESRRKPELAGCRSAEELLENVWRETGTEEALDDEELDMLYAAGGALEKMPKPKCLK